MAKISSHKKSPIRKIKLPQKFSATRYLELRRLQSSRWYGNLFIIATLPYSHHFSNFASTKFRDFSKSILWEN